MEVFRLAKIIENLAQTRPIFHSEADFQHALAWEIHQQFPTWRIRLEVPVRTAKGVVHIDLLTHADDYEIALELKYKTRKQVLSLSNEDFALANQGAQDLGRYDFCKDVARLEAFARSGPNRSGIAVFLTNDSAYWKTPRQPDNNHFQFAMHHGRRLGGRLEWGHRTGAGTMRGRESAIELSGQYELCWQNYSTITPDRYGAFKFLCLEASPLPSNQRPRPLMP